MKNNQSLNEIENRVGTAEELIRRRSYQEALDILSEAAKADPENGRIAFDLGNIAVFQEEFELALKYYTEAEKRGYGSYRVYQNMAVAKEKTGEWKQAERAYLKAVELTQTQEERLIVLSAQALFYLRGNMMLKADKTARRIMEEFPEEYQGHHLYYLVQLQREEYQEMENHFEEIASDFQKHPQYLIDRLAGLELSGKEMDVLHMIEENPSVMKMIPKLALHKKIELSLKKQEQQGVTEDTEKEIRHLFEEYGDLDAAFSVMVLDMTKGNYVRAGAVSNWILEQDFPKKNLRFYATMYLQIFIFYFLSEGKPEGNILELMKKEAAICIEWMEENGLADQDMYEALKMVIS